MAKTADRAASDGLAPKEVGRQLRHVRRKQGLSRSEVARSAGLTRRELAAYERGRAEVPESDLWCLAGSCGVDVSELLPNRAPVKVSSDLSLLAIGDSIRYLRDPVEDDEMLREYLSMIYELRNLPPGSRIPLRERDLMSLADALGGSPERIEARLVELIGMSHQEAARLRSMIMPAPSLPAPAADAPASDNVYSELADSTPVHGEAEVVDFFSTPRANDVFEPPPPPGAMPASSGWSDAFETPSYAPFGEVEPLIGPGAATAPYDGPTETIDVPAPIAPMDPFASPAAPFSPEPPPAGFAPEPPPVVFTPEPPPPPFGYLADEPVASEWPAHVPETDAPSAFDAPPAHDPPGAFDALPAFDPPRQFNAPPSFDPPTVDWGIDESPSPTFGADATLPSFAEPADSPEHWADSEPLPRRLPLQGNPVPTPTEPPEPPQAPELLSAPDSWMEPLAPAPPAHTAPIAPPAAPIDATPFAIPSAPAETAPIFDIPAELLVPETLVPAPQVFGEPQPEPAPPVFAEPPMPTPPAPPVFAEPQPQPVMPAPPQPEPVMFTAPPVAAVAPEPPAPVMPVVPPTPQNLMPQNLMPEHPMPDAPAPSVAPVAPPQVAPIAWNATTAPPPPAAPVAEAMPAPAAGPSFERAGSNWRIGGIFPATATADDGALALRRADARWALADVSAPGDFELETAFDFTAGSGFGVLFRATVDDQDRVSGYSFDIDPIAGGGGYLVRQWEDNRQHWRPIAQASVPDPTLLFGRHTVAVSLKADQLSVAVDGETVLSVPALSRCSVELGREPCRGPHVGVQAWATTEVTVDSFRVARF